MDTKDIEASGHEHKYAGNRQAIKCKHAGNMQTIACNYASNLQAIGMDVQICKQHAGNCMLM